MVFLLNSCSVWNTCKTSKDISPHQVHQKYFDPRIGPVSQWMIWTWVEKNLSQNPLCFVQIGILECKVGVNADKEHLDTHTHTIHFLWEQFSSDFIDRETWPERSPNLSRKEKSHMCIVCTVQFAPKLCFNYLPKKAHLNFIFTLEKNLYRHFC